jgi:selT/selW/selH-like putative selenoprotein
MASLSAPDIALPRIAIKFCTQCKWNLRAAYFAQELLSTFSTTIGEVALIPASGGVFTVVLTYLPEISGDEEASGEVKAETVLLWDRKAEGGFPGELYFVSLCFNS